MLRLAHSIEVTMKAVPLMSRCRAGGGWRRREGARDRRRWRLVVGVLLLLVIALVFLLARCPLSGRLGLSTILLASFFGLPFRLDARDLLLAHCFLWGIDYYLRRKARICEMRIARVDEVDCVRGGEAGGGRL